MTPVWAGPWLLLQQLVASTILWQGWSSQPLGPSDRLKSEFLSFPAGRGEGNVSHTLHCSADGPSHSPKGEQAPWDRRRCPPGDLDTAELPAMSLALPTAYPQHTLLARPVAHFSRDRLPALRLTDPPPTHALLL